MSSFQRDSPSTVGNRGRLVRLTAIAKAFEEHVEIRDRRYLLRMYRSTFLGSDAVEVLTRILNNDIGDDDSAAQGRQEGQPSFTRQHAVLVGRALAEHLNLFEHVTRDHVLKDDYLMYRFIAREKRLRRKPPPAINGSGDKKSSSVFDEDEFFSSLLNADGNGDTNAIAGGGMEEDSEVFDEWKAVNLLTEAISLLYDSKHSTSFRIRSSLQLSQPPKRLEKQEAQQFADTGDADLTCNLMEIADLLESGVHVKTNWYSGVPYRNSFVGADAVDFMVSNRLARSRYQAEQIGRTLMRDYNLFEHVSQQHDFMDDFLFYRFTDPSKRIMPVVTANDADTNASQQEEKDDDQLFPEQSSIGLLPPLEDIAKDFEEHVTVSDHRYRLINYKNTFVGTDAVDFLVKARYASCRNDALALGQRLAKELNLFVHVTREHDLLDDGMFYRYVDPDKRKHPASSRGPTAPGGARSPAGQRSLREIADAFKAGVKTTTHRYHLRKYKHTFVGSDAVSFMVNTALANNRREAVELGRKLADEMGLFRHVTGDHPFKDDHLFYRFAQPDESTEYDATSSVMSATYEDLRELAEAMRTGIEVKNRRYYHRVYKSCFVGRDAVDFLLKIGAASSRFEAVQLGRDIARETNLFQHVADEHELKDESLFYRFLHRDESLYDEGLLAKLKPLAKQFEIGVGVKDNRYRLRTYPASFVGSEAIDWMVSSGMADSREEAVKLGRDFAKTFRLFEHVSRHHPLEDDFLFYYFVPETARRSWAEAVEDEVQRLDWFSPEELEGGTEEALWKQKIAAFEKKVAVTGSSVLRKTTFHTAALSNHSKMTSVNESAALDRVQQWASEFRRLDPRYQILTYFTDVAQIGPEHFDQGIIDAVRPMLLYMFRASVFTVWRPTSLEAIRKMMCGQAVGKGLDIKGKSAKRGKLSGFVPFLQIRENRHKRVVRSLGKNSKIRLFFSGNSRRSRDKVVNILEKVAANMIETVQEARRILSNPSASDDDREEAKESLSLDMEDPSIYYLDDYAPAICGLEIPARLFWEAYVVRQNIACKGTRCQYHPGRPSTPSFQDMNNGVLCAPPRDGAPRAVLWQNADRKDPMNPLELLMAYEEHGRVLPVVSDFDAFLVGTRRVTYDKPLPADQQDLLKWSVSQIERILDGPPRHENWTARWLEILKEASSNGFHPNIPRFGFADPKSYSIMENAVSRLTTNGAVRHGAESFNYYFPQELDDEFLVISDQLDGNVPWAYMDVEGLQSFLSERIQDGYTFPLSPKWVLCDRGWGELYDKLLASERRTVQDSMRVWYPPESGIREQIASIRARHPDGFQRQRKQRKDKKILPGVSEKSIESQPLPDGYGVRLYL